MQCGHMIHDQLAHCLTQGSLKFEPFCSGNYIDRNIFFEPFFLIRFGRKNVSIHVYIYIYIQISFEFPCCMHVIPLAIHVTDGPRGRVSRIGSPSSLDRFKLWWLGLAHWTLWQLIKLELLARFFLRYYDFSPKTTPRSVYQLWWNCSK